MEQQSQIPLRQFLLHEVSRFIEDASRVPGVVRIALVGSLVTDKPQPKDADLLVTIGRDIDIDSLAVLGRRLKGRGQSRGVWSVRASGNWRVTFKFDGPDAIDVNYEDHH